MHVQGVLISLSFSQDPETIDWEQYWNPNLFIENLYGEAKETIWHTLTFDESGHATVCEKRRVNGTFLEYLELETFPFDTQVSQITIPGIYAAASSCIIAVVVVAL